MSLVVFTALVGMVVAPGDLHPWLFFLSLLCIAVGAGASGALNMWYDCDIDAMMARTAHRAIPRGKILPGEALSFGLFLSALSVLVLGMSVGWVPALFLAFTIFFYAIIYTIYLKRSTVQNIVIGGAAGAFPPMVGWSCVTGQIGWESVSLFLLIFFWTPPHFWALALYRASDYAKAGVPMMPVVHGIGRTKLEILVYACLLCPVALLPYGVGIGGEIYLGTGLALSAYFVWLAFQLWRAQERAQEIRRARKLFRYSLMYLFLLFCVLLGEGIVARFG